MARIPKSRTPIPARQYAASLRQLVALALREDIGPGDATVAALQLDRRRTKAAIFAKSNGMLAGADTVEAVFRALDRNARVTWQVREGKQIRRGQRVATITATPAALLSGERTALNFLSRLSGTATAARAFADKLARYPTRLLDTRKTTPGWRLLEKRAAAVGGAVNHRAGLYDAVMIKSNHVCAVGDFAETVRRAMKRRGKKTLVCEVRTMAEVRVALAAGVGWLLLDHFRGQRLRKAIDTIRRYDKQNGTQTVIEASGNMTLRTVASVAACGPDHISVGAITHSPPSVDFSMTLNI